MNQAYDRMISDIPQIFEGGINAHHPKLIIAIDEAHPLSEKEEKFQPAHILCRAISAYSRFTESMDSIWVVFASTTMKVADFAVPDSAIRAFAP